MPLRSISNLEEIFDFQNRAKLLGIDYLSNNYLFADSFLELIRDKKLFGYFQENATLILNRATETLPKLFYYAEQANSLDCAIKRSKLMEEVLVEIRNSDFGPVHEIFLKNGFSVYEVLIEYYHFGNITKVITNEFVVSLAQRSDLGSIQFLIETNFDPLIDLIPKESEINTYIDGGNVLVARTEKSSQSIVGLCISFPAGNLTKIHYLVVANEVRGKGIALKLLSALHVNSRGRIQLWVKESNIGAVAFYARVGFKVGENKRYFLRGKL